MTVGSRIYTKVRRPEKALVEAFRGLPVATISDSMGKFYCVDSGIKTIGKKKLLGPAVTVRSQLADNLLFHKAIDMAQPGDVIVVDAGGCTHRGLCGDIMCTYAHSRGIVGFVVDGGVRDIDTLDTLDFALFARGVNPRGPYKNGPGEINVPVSIGGQVVFSGDILVGDHDGIVVIRPGDAANVLEKTRKIIEAEEQMHIKIDKGQLSRDWVDQEIRARDIEIIDDYYASSNN
jgi:RraA family protein